MNMKRKREKWFAFILVAALCINLMPATAFAAEASVSYIHVTSWSGEIGNSEPAEVELNNNLDDSIGQFVYGNDGDSYTLTENAGILLVNNVDVTLGDGGSVGDYTIAGTGSLRKGNCVITPGSYTRAYDGDTSDAASVFAFFKSGEWDEATYSYEFTGDSSISVETAYDVTVATTGSTLTLKSGLTIKHALSATGAGLVPDGEFLLTIDENATVSGLPLYDTNGEDSYLLMSTPHDVESFAYTGRKWVRQDPGSGDPDEPLSAPVVSFRVQNTDTSVGNVKYKIEDGGWKDAVLSLEGEGESQYLSGTIEEELTQGTTIYIKAEPAEGYEIDTTRGISVGIDNNDGSPIEGGVTSVTSDDGLSYVLTDNSAYEFELGFQSTQGGGESGGGEPQSSPTVSFRVQNTDVSVGTVQYHINDNAWQTISLNLEGETGNQYLSASISETLSQNDRICIKAIPGANYELDSGRGVKVYADGNGSDISGGATSIVSEAGLTYDLTENYSYEFEFGFQQTVQDPGSEGGEGVTPQQIKGAVEGRHWAYVGPDIYQMRANLVKELWDLLSHEFPGFFANKTALDSAISVSYETSTIGSELKFDLTPLPYYTFTLELDENDEYDASGRLYSLNESTDYVVCTKFGNVNSFHIVSGEECNVVADYDSIGVFGNGAAIIGGLGSGDNYAAFHVADRARLGASAFRLTVYKPAFTGAKLATSDTYVAPAWGFAQAKITEFGGTEATPTQFDVFYGNSSVTLSTTAISDDDITAITGITTSLPSQAVTITDNGSGSYTVTFNSNYYNEVPLIIAYTDGSGVAKTGYMTLQRVGVDIKSYQKMGDATTYNTNHGTEPGLSGKAWGSDNYVVYASYYYPTNSSTVDSVDLFVTSTWENGTVKRTCVSESERTAANGNAVAIEDFIVYKGNEEDAPIKIEVTAVKRGTDMDRFAGVTIGSGAGVEWRR